MLFYLCIRIKKSFSSLGLFLIVHISRRFIFRVSINYFSKEDIEEIEKYIPFDDDYEVCIKIKKTVTWCGNACIVHIYIDGGEIVGTFSFVLFTFVS